MKAAIFTIGNEVLSGKTLNTNSQYLSIALASLGFKVVRHLTVEDDGQVIEEVIRELFKEVDLIITTGGLGPTYDDITFESIARGCGRKTILFEEVLKDIEEKFKKFGSPMGDNNRKQAYLMEGSEVLENKFGTAPGMFCDLGGKYIIALPGPPRENMPLFEQHVAPKLSKILGREIHIKDLVCYGVGESNVEVILGKELVVQPNIRIATYVKPRYVIIRLTSQDQTIIDDHAQRIYEIFTNHIIGEDDMTLEKKVVEMMTEQKLTLSLAESCTGGMIASHIVSVPGSSAVLESSLVTYSNQAKTIHLGVEPTILETYGAVSKETARQMVEGLKKVSESDVCLAVTGIAGPGGGTEEKPIGRTYIAIKCREYVEVKEYDFFGDRQTIRHRATLTGLNLIRMELLKQMS
jgi:nicotinamide-nucleotide amidase